MTNFKLTRRAVLQGTASTIAMSTVQGCARTAQIGGLNLSDDHDIRLGMYAALIGKEGISEVPGPLHNADILEMHQTTSLAANDDETPWCSSAVNWAAKVAGTEGTNSAAARSWLDWKNGRAISLEIALRGDVIIFWRGSRYHSWQGHVALYHGPASNQNEVLVLGGNQNNSVNISAYPKSRLLGVRRAIRDE